MTFDLGDLASITTITYAEPTLWASVILTSFVAVLVGHMLGHKLGHIRNGWRRRLYGVVISLVVAVLLVVATVVLLDLLFSRYHRGMVCTVFVTPALFLPPLIGLLAERVAWRRAQASLT
jgi:hypothetical protein